MEVSPELLKTITIDVGLEYDSTLSVIETARKLITHINHLQAPRVIRTIHPVGQGAMYSERFLDKDGMTVF